MRPRSPIVSGLLLLVVAAGGPGVLVPVSAAEPPAVALLEVALWPEYDRSQMLVMLEGELAPGEALPAEVALPIPEGVAAPHAAAFRDALGLKVAEHRVESQDGQRVVRMTVPSRSFRLEYYDELQRQDGHRSYAFEWTGTVDVSSLRYEVQVPAGARDFTVVPSPSETTVGADGLTYRHSELGAVSPGQAARIEISYQKTSDVLSAPGTLPTVPAAPMPAAPMAGGATPAGGGVAPPRGTDALWPIYVAAALLVGVFLGMGIQRLRG